MFSNNHRALCCTETSLQYLCHNEIIKAEGGKGRLFNEDEVINLDIIEKTIAANEKRNCNSTMDILIGLSKKSRDKHVAFVEFKFDVKKPTTLSKADIECKVRDSIALVGQEPKILKKFYFIFSDSVVAQAKSYLHRKFLGKPNNPYEAITEAELHDLYW